MIESFKSGLENFTRASMVGLPSWCWQRSNQDICYNNHRYSAREIAEVLKISVANHLHQIAYVNDIDVWLPDGEFKKI